MRFHYHLLFILTAFLLLTSVISPVFAQESVPDTEIELGTSAFEETDEDKPLQAIITSEDKVQVNKNIIFHSNTSFIASVKDDRGFFKVLAQNQF